MTTARNTVATRPMWLNVAVFALLVAIAVMQRTSLHLWNFAPIIGLALFAGFFFRNRWLALAAPLAALLISDALLGFYVWQMLAIVYAAQLVPVFAGGLLRRWTNPLAIGGAGLASSLWFFAVSNFAHWIVMGGYPMTLGGLGACYAAGLPFLRGTILGDLVWTAIFFGGYMLVTELRRGLTPKPAVAA